MMKRAILCALSVMFLGGAAQAAKAADIPNILFFIADDSSCHYGCYGCDWSKTPNVDDLAKRGIVFENAYTPTAKCAPSRSAILTGRNPWQLEDAANHQSIFPSKFKAFTEVISEAGFYVGSQGKFWGPGNAYNADGSPRKWGLATSGGESHNPDDCKKFAEFLAARPKDKPFFFWFGSTNPHRPYPLDSGLAAGKKPSDIEHVPAFWPDNDTVRKDMLDYAVEVETYDAQIGGLLKELEKSGEADNTLIVVTSDHGMPFPRVKGHNYDLANRVPLVACWPKGIANPGRRVTDFISNIEFAPTFLELFGLSGEKAGMSPITGYSMTDLLKGKPAHDRSYVILGRERTDVRARPGTEHGLGYPIRGIRVGSLFYLHNFAPDRWPCGNRELGLLDTDGSPTKTLIDELNPGEKYWEFCFGKRPEFELFDISTDPDCVKNLAAESGYAEQIKSMDAKMTAELKKQDDPRILGQGDVFDNYTSAKKPAGEKPAAKGKKKPAT